LKIAKDIRDWDAVAPILADRVGFIEGVVFSGGEPTLYDGLADAMRSVHEMGLKVALHTGGQFPERFAQLLMEGLVDWIGLDCKAPIEMYDRITGVKGSVEPFLRSIKLLVASRVEHEVRTTMGHEVADLEVLMGLARQLQALGATRWVLQQRREGGLNGGFNIHPPADIMREWGARISDLTGLDCRVRAD
jgi:pyruvate formate lyase activating enzyme